MGLIWAVCAIVIVGVVARPFRLPEAVWAVAGAVLLVLGGALPPASAGLAVAKGRDVYLFLVGMMLLSETARREGLFAWLADHAAARAAGSGARLFALVFAIGVVVTTFLSNDATAVVLTPAVCAAARRAKADPLPLLLACALVANAASFILPISNPANLVLYGGHMPPLGPWLASFALPSVAALAVSFATLALLMRRRLARPVGTAGSPSPIPKGAGVALGGIAGTAVLLLVASAKDWPLGLPTCVAGAATAALSLAAARRSPWPLLRAVSWSILPLVAGLFVLVEALATTGITDVLASVLTRAVAWSAPAATVLGATLVALAVNLTNNLPAGLLAGEVIAHATPPRAVTDALLIAIDLGPNLSVSGSLATILWLQAIRREGEAVGFWQFLGYGVVVMPAALAAALAVRLIAG